MHKLILFIFLVSAFTVVQAEISPPKVQVEVHRVGSVYALAVRLDSTLPQCVAYQYLTDYDAAKGLPGMVESVAVRQSADTVLVEQTTDEQVLLLRVRLHSKMEYKEHPMQGISFTQLTGDSKRFEGKWHIYPNAQGSTLHFEGLWEPDTVIPFFVIDHFAKNGLIDRFSEIAALAEKNKYMLSHRCSH
jgi:hypothetical protein